MKVLLVSPNVEFLPDPVFPLGLASIAATLKENRIPHHVLDLCFAEDFERAIADAVSAHRPDLFALSLRNLDNVAYPNYSTYLPFYRKVVQRIREHSRAPVVIGGSGFSVLPEPVLKHLEADFGIVGEGETALLRLIRHLEGCDRMVMNGRGVIDDPTLVVQDLDEIPIPDRSGFDSEAYLRLGGMGNLQTKRGCPFRCAYCTYPIIEGRAVRLRSAEKVCNEIEDMLRIGIDHLFFVDSVFNYPMHQAEGICREMVRRRLPIRWSCYAHPKFITPALLRLMQDSGCTGLEFGTEAAHDGMLRNLCKDFTVEDVRQASHLCREAGMPFCHSLLLGGPGETMATVRETVQVVNDMSPTAVICMIGIRVFPKTRLAQVAVEEGRISPNANFLDPVFYLSKDIEEEILPFIEDFSKGNPTWIFPGLNINMNVALQKKLRRFGVKGPLWEYMKMGERFRKRGSHT